MEPETLVGKLRDLIKVGETDGRPWAIVRFKDLWDAGFASVRKDKIEDALQVVLKEAGIDLDLDFDPEDPDAERAGYVTFVSATGRTIYVGKTEITDWIDTTGMFDSLKEVVEAN